MFRRRLVIAASTMALGLGAGASLAAAQETSGGSSPTTGTVAPPRPPSVALGVPWCGHLLNGVALPPVGRGFFTWDFPLRRAPNRYWRRYGTARLLALVQRVMSAYADAHPGLPRIGIADLSLPRGGPFGERYGGVGHLSHQNGLDVDVLYPRRDRTERPARYAWEVDAALAQDLLNRFVAAGVEHVFIGYRVRVYGRWPRVARAAFHDDHMHVRIRPLRPVRAPLRCPWRAT